MILSPFGACSRACRPTAYAVGYILSPLRGLSFVVRVALPYSFAATGRSASCHCRTRRWARVSPGAAARARRSAGLSTSSAMPGRESTHAGFPGGLGCGMVRLETVVAEACGKQSGGAPQDGVGAASIGGAHQHGTFGGRGLQNLFQFPSSESEEYRPESPACCPLPGTRRSGWPFRWHRFRCGWRCRESRRNEIDAPVEARKDRW